MEKIRVNRSTTHEDTGSVVCLTTKGRQLEWNFEELKPASHVPILGTILNIFDVFVAVFFSLLNSLNLVERLITSRYLFLCAWICLSVLFMFFSCCIVINSLHEKLFNPQAIQTSWVVEFRSPNANLLGRIKTKIISHVYYYINTSLHGY